MIETTIEIEKINLRFENFRLQNNKVEKNLFSSITDKGVERPILGFFENDSFVLLDGHKRYRCCLKLKIHLLPCEVICDGQVSSLFEFLRSSNEKTLHVLEQAKIIEELHVREKMSVKDIASKLEKSSAWVSLRLSLLSESTPVIYDLIRKDHFPVRNYMYTLRQFTRVNKVPLSEIETFMQATAQKGLSTRDIDLLAQGYFTGGQEIKTEIKSQNFYFALQKMKQKDNDLPAMNESEKSLHKDLEILHKYISRVIFKLPKITKDNTQFFSTGGLLVEGVRDKLARLKDVLLNFTKEFEDDHRGEGQVDLVTLSRGNKNDRDFQKTSH